MIRTKKIAILAIIAMVLTLLPVSLFAATADSNRLSGADRIGTAIEVADAGWTTAGTVILAPADQANLVDALAAAPLAGQENAPILLTGKASLNAATKAKIAALGATKVYVVGAIADSVVAEVNAMTGVTAEKLSGANRWATADAINAKLTAPAGSFVVGYNAIADALSVASFAAAKKYAIVLTNADGTVNASKLVGAKTYLVGGTAVVKDYAGATRLGGADRFATNTAVAQGLSFDYARVYVANGLSMVDALAVAPLAAKYNAFVALASATNVAAASTVNAKLTASSKVIAVGGLSAVSAAVVGQVGVAVSGTFAVASVKATNLNEIVITLSQAGNKTVLENTANYLIDGGALDAANDKIFVSSDKKTVRIVLDAPLTQGSKRIITVDNLWSDNLVTKAAKAEVEVVFSDITTPTVKSVTVDGLRTINVEFSEAIRMTADPSFKINGQSVTNFGFSSITYPDAKTGVNEYSTKVRINFGTDLPVGTHNLEVPAGAGTNLVDAAGFFVAKTTVGFTVSTDTARPVVSSVTAKDNGEVIVTWNKKMGASATDVANYRIVGSATAPTAGFKANTNNTVVELNFGAGVVVEGVNLLEVNKSVADVFGNKLNADDNQRYSVTATKDTVAPTVESVIRTGDTKIRVKYSEKVDVTYAQNAANYKLKDSSNMDVAIATVLAVPTPGTSSDIYEITTTPNLTGSSYTLEIKNIRDLASTPNVMVTATFTITGNDNVDPTVLATVEISGTKVAVFFGETMNASTITNKSNYAYVDGGGTIRSLPSAATVTAKENNKAVEIAFPSSYTVNGAGAGQYDVIQIRVSNVTDLAGNTLAGIAVTSSIVAANNAAVITAVGAKIVKDSIVLEEPTSTSIKATFELNKPLDVFAASDFTVAGKTPASGYLVGNKVVLNFTTAADLVDIRVAGIDATLAVVAATSNSFAGVPINQASFAGDAYVKVYSDLIKPRITSVTVAGQVVSIAYSEAIDASLVGLYKDDFTFAVGGTVLTNPVPTIVGGNVVTYTFAGTPIAAGATVNVKANASTIDITDLEDRAKGKNKYAPTTALTTGINVVEGAGAWTP